MIFIDFLSPGLEWFHLEAQWGQAKNVDFLRPAKTRKDPQALKHGILNISGTKIDKSELLGDT